MPEKPESLKKIDLALKNDQPVLLTYQSHAGLLFSFTQKSLEKLNQLKIYLSYGKFCVVIAEIGQLYDYVAEIPEIAWDIVDFEEKPLIVDYPRGKNIPEIALSETQRVSVMLIKNHPVTKPLYNYGRAAGWIVPDQQELLNRNLKQFEYVLNLDRNEFNIFHPKIMKLEMNGEIKIL